MVSTIKKNLIKSRIASVARVVMALSFASLVFVGVSHLVRAFSVETVNQLGGIPSDWGLTSANHPDEITVPISYWDQDYDCKTFEFWDTNTLKKCGLSKAPGGGGLTQGLVQDTLDSEGLPVPTYATHADAKAAGVDIQSQYITQDNFNHWFHETSKSTRYDREVTFTKQGDKNSYTYGGKQIFPLDGVRTAQTINGHNFHFTSHLRVPIKANLSGDEVFDFTGDDDVWVFLNNQLVLDIGGCHSAIDGSFTINSDGSVTSTVEGKNKKTINLGLTKGQVVNLDFFYAERSTSESNTKITISDMEWPISSESKLKSEIIDGKLIKYTSYLKNSDPSQTIDLLKISSYITDAAGGQKSGFLPLSSFNLQYTTTPKVEESWKALAVNAPKNTEDGFKLENPIHLSAAGTAGDTVYFRYFVKPEENSINYTNTIAYYTVNAVGNHGITYDYATDLTDELEVKPRYVTVGFDSRGGSAVSSQSITKGTVALRPDDPVRPGYQFVGWTYSGDSEDSEAIDYDFNTPVEEDITLVARWELIPKEKYLVSYDSNGGSPIDSEQVEDGDSATEPAAPTRNGYKFLGWTLDGDDSDGGYYDFDTPVHDNIILFADWEKVVFTVTFDSRGGSAVDPQVVNKGDTATHPTDPILRNYKLVDWIDEAGNSYNFASVVTEDITLYAIWEKNVFTVSFDSNGGSSVAAQKVEKGLTATEPEIPTLDDYTFLGWVLGGTGYLFSTPVTADITLVAHWEKTPEEQPVTPDPEESETPSEPEQPVEPTPAPRPPVDPTAPSDDVIIDLTDPEDAPLAPVLGEEEDTMFIPVLGEVAYVPDTGLVTNIMTDPFGSKTFAAIVLSQGYILVNLAVFALSFYLYLSFRRYLPAGGKALLPEGDHDDKDRTNE